MHADNLLALLFRRAPLLRSGIRQRPGGVAGASTSSAAAAPTNVLNFPEARCPVVSDNDHQYHPEETLSYKELPGPKALPIIGNSWRFLPYIGDYQIEHLDRDVKTLYDKYGSRVKIDGLLGRPDMLFLFDPDDIEKVYRHEDSLPLRPSVKSIMYYKNHHKKELFENNAGVIAVHGQEWQNFRSKVNQIMLQPKIAKLYVKSIEQTAQEFVVRIDKLRNECDEMPSDFLNELHKWSLESIARIALDVRLGCLDDNAKIETQKLINAVTTVFATVPILELKFPFWRFFNTPTYKKYITALENINEISMKHIKNALANLDHRNKNEEPSLLQRILEREKDPRTATVLALDLFLVGIDTTSYAVASTLYQLALNQSKQERLRKEINEILPNKDSQLDNEKLDSMIYLKACIREVMRMYPVIILNGRILTDDCIIGGYRIPKGVQVIFQHYAISNLEKYFSKSDQFIPERWIKDCPHLPDGVSRDHHAFASVPFGFGKRMCLGRRFADLEIQIAISKIIQNYRIEFHHEKLQYHVHPTYGPHGPLKLRFINHEDAS